MLLKTKNHSINYYLADRNGTHQHHSLPDRKVIQIEDQINHGFLDGELECIFPEKKKSCKGWWALKKVT